MMRVFAMEEEVDERDKIRDGPLPVLQARGQRIGKSCENRTLMWLRYALVEMRLRRGIQLLPQGQTRGPLRREIQGRTIRTVV